MSDKEMLELAAKAAGIVGIYRREHQAYGDHWVDGIDTGARFWWNPLEDDGDALRLAVRLNLLILPYPSDNAVRVVNFETNDNSIVSFGTPADPRAATRRAIVRAAAEIGREM